VTASSYDVFIVHDPQPAGIRHFARSRRGKWIWRCHIDSSAPDESVRNFLVPLIQEYDRCTIREFLLPGLDIDRSEFIAPAIDAFATKNMELPRELCRLVSEALWKEKPVVAGRAGGIPMQFPRGFERYLVSNVEDCATQILHLLRHIGDQGDFARAGREHVRGEFLLPRLARDELILIKNML
jgi:hypothetical protein